MVLRVAVVIVRLNGTEGVVVIVGVNGTEGSSDGSEG